MVFTERRAFTTPSFPHPPLSLTIAHDADDVPLRTGCRLWSAAYALVERLSARDGADVRDRRVLELGAGVGAAGLACAALGARSVTLSDRDEGTLALAHGNALRNGWFDGTRACDVRVKALDWGRRETWDENENERRAYDVIVAADMLYLEEHAEELATAVDAHAKSGGGTRFIAAFGVRKPALAAAFESALRARGFVVRTEALDADVCEDMRTTAAEHAHDDEITAKGGYRLLIAERDEAAVLADFVEALAVHSEDGEVRRYGDGDDGDDGDECSLRVDFDDACSYALRVERATPDADTIDAAAESLRVHGFVVLSPVVSGAIVPEDTLAECARANDEHLDELLARAETRGVDSRRDIFRYAEICSRARCGLRYDFTRPECERVRALAKPNGQRAVSAWEALGAYVSPWVSPILSKAYGADYDFTTKSLGCVSSEPGAPEQHFHADGRVFGIFNVFINTAKVETIDGPTAFIHGSHEWDHDACYVSTPERKAQALAPRTQPELLFPGSVLIYDYRVMHKGGANDSARRRSLAYVMFCSRRARDSWNFPLDDSIWDSDATTNDSEDE